MEDVVFEFFIGDTYTRDIIISGYSENIDNVFFTIKKNVTDKNYVLQKTLGNGIELTDVVYDDDETTILSRTYNILLNANDTEDMKPDTEYVFDFEIVTDENSDDIKKTVMTGTVNLKNAATRVYNE